MRLYLLRHALAVPRGTSGYTQDARRPLTEEGRVQAKAVAQGLKQLNTDIEVIASSPYVRAVQTAAEVARVLGYQASIKELDALRAECAPAETSQALEVFKGHAHVLLVGHEPHLSAWIAELTAGKSSMRCQMKKAGVACIEVERVPPPAGSGTLLWLMTPKQLSAIGRS